MPTARSGRGSTTRWRASRSTRQQPGYKHTILRPQPGGDLTCAAARLETPYGELVSDWKLENGRFSWEIVVPPNTTATAILPNGETHELAAGRHRLG